VKYVYEFYFDVSHFTYKFGLSSILGLTAWEKYSNNYFPNRSVRHSFRFRESTRKSDKEVVYVVTTSVIRLVSREVVLQVIKLRVRCNRSLIVGFGNGENCVLCTETISTNSSIPRIKSGFVSEVEKWTQSTVSRLAHANSQHIVCDAVFGVRSFNSCCDAVVCGSWDALRAERFGVRTSVGRDFP
jgi:hypothetical protein